MANIIKNKNRSVGIVPEDQMKPLLPQWYSSIKKKKAGLSTLNCAAPTVMVYDIPVVRMVTLDLSISCPLTRQVIGHTV